RSPPKDKDENDRQDSQPRANPPAGSGIFGHLARLDEPETFLLNGFDSAQLGRRGTRRRLDRAAHVRLVREAVRKSHFGERLVPAAQQPHGAADPKAEAVALGRHAIGLRKSPADRFRAQSLSRYPTADGKSRVPAHVGSQKVRPVGLSG